MTRRDLDLRSQEPRKLLIEIRALIEEARRQAAVAVNIGLTLLYWRIGRRIHHEVLGSERAAYGEQIVVTLSRQLVMDYGRGYSEKNLRRMVQFAVTIGVRERRDKPAHCRGWKSPTEKEKRLHSGLESCL